MKALRAAALVLVMAPALATAQDGLPPETAAIINGEAITTKEVADRAFQLYGRNELRALIYYRLVAQEAKREGVAVTDQQVKAEIEKMRKQWGNKFSDYVASIGLTEKLLPDQIRHELRIRELIGKNITVTEGEIKEFYEAPKNKSRFHQPETVRFRQIVTESAEKAAEAAEALKQGKDFVEVVHEYSVDEVSLKLDGDIGLDLPRGMLKAEWKPLEDAAFTLPLKQASDPIHVGDKWVIIEVTAKRAAIDISLARAHDEIREEIFKTRLDERSRDWMRDLFERASKEINRSLWE